MKIRIWVTQYDFWEFKDDNFFYLVFYVYEYYTIQKFYFFHYKGIGV